MFLKGIQQNIVGRKIKCCNIFSTEGPRSRYLWSCDMAIERIPASQPGNVKSRLRSWTCQTDTTPPSPPVSMYWPSRLRSIAWPRGGANWVRGVIGRFLRCFSGQLARAGVLRPGSTLLSCHAECVESSMTTNKCLSYSQFH